MEGNGAGLLSRAGSDVASNAHAGTPSLAEMLATDGPLRVLAVQGKSVGAVGVAARAKALVASRALTHACSLHWVRALTSWSIERCMAHLQL